MTTYNYHNTYHNICDRSFCTTQMAFTMVCLLHIRIKTRSQMLW